MTSVPARLVAWLVFLLLVVDVAPAHATRPTSTESTTSASAAKQCEDFAQRQVNLATKLLRKDDFPGALRVLNVAAENCDIPLVRNQIADVLDNWYSHIQNRGIADRLPTFVDALSEQSYLPSGVQAKLRRQIADDTASLIAQSHRQGNDRETYRLCQQYARYSGETFAMNYRCGAAARNVQAYGAAIASYDWLLDNWDANQSYVTWDEVAADLTDAYLATARFGEAFTLSKRLTRRNASAENVLTSLASARALFLEPILRTGRVLFDGVTPETALDHATREMERVGFPSHVQSLFLLTASGTADAVFYGGSAAALPPEDPLRRASGPVSLLRTDDPTGRAWLVTPVDAGYFVVQFARSTSPEENVILENLLNNPQDEGAWDNLYAYQFRQAAPGTGSAVATLLGGAYLASGSLGSYDAVVGATDAVAYFCVQDESGSVTHASNFSRSSITYDEGAWTQSSKTPALYHHEVTRNGTRIREVVWPTYDGERWVGVIRVGLALE